MNNLLVSFFIYSYFFTSLGNTVFRKDENNELQFSIIPLFTAGFTGPIKTIYNLVSVGEYDILYEYLLFESYNLANPMTAYCFTCFIDNLLKSNTFCLPDSLLCS